MIILAVLCLLLAVGLVIAVMKVLKAKQDYLQLKAELSGEFAAITGAMDKFSRGLLNQKLARSRAFLPDYVKRGMNRIRASFNKISSDPLNRVCYVGTDAWFEGMECARYVGNKLIDGGKIVIIVTSSLEAIIMEQRHRSFLNTIKKDFSQVKVIETFEAHANLDVAADYIASMSDKIDGVYVTGNSIVPGVVAGLEKSGCAGRVFIVCHDLDSNIVDAMQKGFVSASLVSAPYLQARDAIIHLYNHVATGWKPFQPRLMQKLNMVTVGDLDEYWDFEAGGTKRPSTQNLVEPKRTTILKSRRIVVLVEDWNASFKEMLEGAKEAQTLLAEHDCEVVFYTINQLRNPEREVLEKVKGILSDEMAKGLDGIAAFVGVASMVDVLNSYAVQGIPVASFNSEPLCIRSMIEWLCASSEQLGLVTKQYEAALKRINETRVGVTQALSQVEQKSQDQMATLEQGSVNMGEFSGYIDESDLNDKAQTQSVEDTTAICKELEEVVKSFDGAVSSIKEVSDKVKVASLKTSNIKDFSEKIGAILSILDAISGQTNLLAFNAAVESTHAGEFGEGFKVISQEIRGLADQSIKSTADIALLIESMKAAVEEGIAANNETLSHVNAQVEAITSMSEKLTSVAQNLLDSVTQVAKAASANNQVFSKMKDKSALISDAISSSANIFEVSRESAHQAKNDFGFIASKLGDMQERTRDLSSLITIMSGTVSSFSSI